jgi:hypothetical protein
VLTGAQLQAAQRSRHGPAPAPAKVLMASRGLGLVAGAIIQGAVPCFAHPRGWKWILPKHARLLCLLISSISDGGGGGRGGWVEGTGMDAIVVLAH